MQQEVVEGATSNYEECNKQLWSLQQVAVTSSNGVCNKYLWRTTSSNEQCNKVCNVKHSYLVYNQALVMVVNRGNQKHCQTEINNLFRRAVMVKTILSPRMKIQRSSSLGKAVR